MSQIGDFMVVLTPCGSLLALRVSGLKLRILMVTLAHQGPESQAGFPHAILRAEAIGRDRARTHSVWQNMQPEPQHHMQPGAAVLSLALLMWR
jgi:hypothetical protein